MNAEFGVLYGPRGPIYIVPSYLQGTPACSYINCTPHAIDLISTGGHHYRLSPSGVMPRVGTVAQPQANDVLSTFDVAVSATKLTAVQGLPVPRHGVLLIVSGMVLDHPDCAERTDLRAPDTTPDAQVRNSAGRIIGIKRLRVQARQQPAPTTPAPAPTTPAPAAPAPTEEPTTAAAAEREALDALGVRATEADRAFVGGYVYPQPVKLPAAPSYREVYTFGPLSVAAKVIKILPNGALLGFARPGSTVLVPSRRAAAWEIGSIVEIRPSALAKGDKGWRADPTGVDASNRSWAHGPAPKPTIYSSVEEALSAIEEADKAYKAYERAAKAAEAERKAILAATPHVVVDGVAYHMGACPRVCDWINGVSHPDLGKGAKITLADGMQLQAGDDARWEGMTLIAAGRRLACHDVAEIRGMTYDMGDDSPGLFYHDDRYTSGGWTTVVFYRNDTVKIDVVAQAQAWGKALASKMLAALEGGDGTQVEIPTASQAVLAALANTAVNDAQFGAPRIEAKTSNNNRHGRHKVLGLVIPLTIPAAGFTDDCMPVVIRHRGGEIIAVEVMGKDIKGDLA